ncbi:lysozyme [Erwinia psidii]|uniref:glycoside hydrolase family protein n=1 Tax=Erwinia psidii TaxID=69224 RepID=UPI00226B10EE|nr:glycoside hydrolase family protein [Erwinia psidii]MCX8965727.1 lysozyme [Erwinia psidii]
MSQIVALLKFEEGYRDVPFIDTQGYPTVGCGIKIGPKGAPLTSYIFRMPAVVGELWMQTLVMSKIYDMKQKPLLVEALTQCNQPRTDILYSMAYQLGVDGLVAFRQMLAAVSRGDFSSAADNMLNSLWAKQTPERAKRHAAVMRSGCWDTYRGLL